MGQNLNQILWGEGVAYLDGKELFEIQELAITFGLESLQAVKGDGGGNIVIPTNQPLTGRAGFLGINAAILAELTGATTSTGTKKRIRKEQQTVSSNAITLDNTPIANTMRVVEDGALKIPLRQVSGSPAAADEYQLSTATLTFNTGTFANGTVINVWYIYTDGADGETSQLAPGALPGAFELYGSLRTKELFGDTKDDLIFYAAKCERTSEFALGGAIGNISVPGFDFNIRIDNNGDFDVYWP